MSHYSLEDLIYRANSNSFDSKKEGVSGKDIELKFLIDARKNIFKIDSNIREYRFTDEDKLAFSMDEREFFDLFDRQDRDLGTYIKEVYQAFGSRSLPSKVWINHKLNNSCIHRDLMNRVQKSCSKKVMSLGEIAEKLLKNIGYNSVSNSQIGDFAKKLADENRLNGDPVKLLLFKDQLEKLSTKVIESFYKNATISNQQKDSVDKGSFKANKGDASVGSIKDLKERLKK
ncbi:MAG: hypothetical protein ACRCVW_03180 [Brevinema sp.]